MLFGRGSCSCTFSRLVGRWPCHSSVTIIKMRRDASAWLCCSGMIPGVMVMPGWCVDLFAVCEETSPWFKVSIFFSVSSPEPVGLSCCACAQLGKQHSSGCSGRDAQHVPDSTALLIGAGAVYVPACCVCFGGLCGRHLCCSNCRGPCFGAEGLGIVMAFATRCHQHRLICHTQQAAVCSCL